MKQDVKQMPVHKTEEITWDYLSERTSTKIQKKLERTYWHAEFWKDSKIILQYEPKQISLRRPLEKMTRLWDLRLPQWHLQRFSGFLMICAAGSSKTLLHFHRNYRVSHPTCKPFLIGLFTICVSGIYRSNTRKDDNANDDDTWCEKHWTRAV